MPHRPYGVTRRETIRNFGFQDPRLQIGDWVVVSLMNTDGSTPNDEVPSVDAFNAVEAGEVSYYDEFNPQSASDDQSDL